jgi:serine/threonine protein kinase
VTTFQELAPLNPEEERSIGGYTLRGRVGSGGFKTVYLGVSESGNRAAVGILHGELARDDVYRRSFDLEIDAILLARGPFIARVTGHELGADQPWMVSEFVDGYSLTRARASCSFDDRTTVLLAAGWARALADIHSAGVIHRDFKPGNILIHEGGSKVVDFGIAHLPHGDTTATLSRSGRRLGTPDYMSPEQALGEEITQASDVFSWAGTVCFTASGEPPFGFGLPNPVLFRVVYEEPAVPELPAELDDLVRSAFAKDPADRPTTGEILSSLSSQTELTASQTASEAAEALSRNWNPPPGLFTSSYPLPEPPTLRPPPQDHTEPGGTKRTDAERSTGPAPHEPTGGTEQATRTPKQRRRRWLMVGGIAAVLLLAYRGISLGDSEKDVVSPASTPTTLEQLDSSEAPSATEPSVTTPVTESSEAPPESTSLPPPPEDQDGSDQDPGASDDESLVPPDEPGDCSIRGESLKIGTLFTESGNSELQVMGDRWRLAVEIAVEEMNALGGVNGFPVELVNGDEGEPAGISAADVAPESVDRLLCEEGVHAIVGPALFPTAIEVMDQIADFPAVMCSTAITASAVGTVGDNGLFFSILPHNLLTGEALADYLFEHGQQAVSVLYRDNLSRDGVGPAFTRMFERLGGRTVFSRSLNSQSLGEFIESPSSVLVILGAGVNVAELSEIFDELTFAGLTPEDLSIYSTIGLTSIEDFGGTPGAAFASALRTFNPGPNPSTGSEFYGKVVVRSPDGVVPFDAHVYDCAILIGLAAELGASITESIDTEDISRWLISPARAGELCSSFEECVQFARFGNQLNYEGASGPVDFDYDGNLRGGMFQVYEFDSNGSWDEAEEWKFVAPCSIEEEGYTYIEAVDGNITTVMKEYSRSGALVADAEILFSRILISTFLGFEECFFPDEWEMLRPVFHSLGEQIDALEELRDAVIQYPDGSHEDLEEEVYSSGEPIFDQSCVLSSETGVPVPGFSEWAEC